MTYNINIRRIITKVKQMTVNLCQMLSLHSILFWFRWHHHKTFRIWYIILFLIALLFSSLYQFFLLNLGACHFGDTHCDEKNFIWCPISTLPSSVRYNYVNPEINPLVGTKSPCYFCVLHIASNFVFAMLLINQVTKIRIYGFVLCTYGNKKHNDI